MYTCLYLDTARLGPMCPEAQRADRDFARLAGEEAGSLYADHFISTGFFSLPPSLRCRYPGLVDWSGISSLKARIRAALGLSRGCSIFLANRSAELVRLAGRCLSERCESILVTDMLWPAYRRILDAECRRRRKHMTVFPARQMILQEGATQQEIVDRIVAHYRHEQCDGLMLSAVTFHGVRMPVREIAAALAGVARPGFVVVDSAQAVKHIPLDLHTPYCDFMIAGCHKWLQAYHPMGLGFCCRQQAEGMVERVCRQMIQRAEIDDPLLALTRELEIDGCEPFSETVNLAPLFTASAAVGRLWRSEHSRREELSLQPANADRMVAISHGTPWRPVRPKTPMRSGILLLEPKRAETRSAPPDTLRFAFRKRAVALSAYQGGLLRISLPQEPFENTELTHLRRAFRHCA